MLQRYFNSNFKMQQIVQKYIQKHQLLLPHSTVIVGVSGGADSVVLLDILLSLGYKCVVAHCNFKLRMDESYRDELFVRNLSVLRDIPYYSIEFDTISYSEVHKLSIEMAARELRYNWFQQLLEELNAQAICVAHHSDDSIETLLMNLVRGTGLRGMAGIPNKNGKVVRPLLCCTRKDVENYIRVHNLQHIEDSSNVTLNYQRNKFRNLVLPLLEEINPSVRQTLYNSLERFAGTLAIYEQAVDELRKQLVEKNNDVTRINIDLLKMQVHVPTVLYELLQPYGFHSDIVEQLYLQLDAECGKVFYSESFRLVKDRNYLIINAKDNIDTLEYTISQFDTHIKSPISLFISTLNRDADYEISKTSNCIHLDASKLQFPLKLRRWRKGDSFMPFGMCNYKKISDFFIDNKFSLLEKEQCWLLVSGKDIVWIVGKRTDNRFRVTDSTDSILEIRIM